MKGLRQLRARYGPLGIPRGVQNIHDQRLRQRVTQNLRQTGLQSAGSGFYSTSKPTTRHLVQSTGAVADLQADLAKTYGPGREALEAEYRLAPSKYLEAKRGLYAALPAYDPSRLMLPGLQMQHNLASQGFWQPGSGFMGGFGGAMGSRGAPGTAGSIAGLAGMGIGGALGGPFGAMIGGSLGSTGGGFLSDIFG